MSIRAVQSYGWKIYIDVEPVERMEKILYNIDELTGLDHGYSNLHPNKKQNIFQIKQEI